MKLITPENVVLIGSLMLLASVLVGKMSSRLGLPSLLLFLFVGMFMGEDGIGYSFSNITLTQTIGIVALCVILFSGGMDTKYSEIKPVVKEGVILATFGVILTALFTGVFIWGAAQLLEFKLSLPESLLLASVMSSTDSASVFSLLRSGGLNLKENLRPTLELESGSNDPMAYMLTITLIEYIKIGYISWTVIGFFLIQLIFGAIAGFLFGKGTVFLVNKVKLDTTALYSILLIATTALIYTLTDMVGGNGYLAVYIAGMIVGNSKIDYKKSVSNFFDVFSWLWQIVMFLTLGLLVNPKELLSVTGLGLLVGTFMILCSRPLTVFITLLPFKRFSKRARLYISWVGLRGAVPIIFATYPLVANLDHSKLIFDVVFFITIMSLIIQGMTVVSSAKFLKVSGRIKKKALEFGVELPDAITSVMHEIEIDENVLKVGNTLGEINFPSQVLAIMIKRGEKYFTPKGGTILLEGDKMLIIADTQEDIAQALKKIS